MSKRGDDRLRELERDAGRGDADARRELIEARARRGLCPWCGEPGAAKAEAEITRLRAAAGD